MFNPLNDKYSIGGNGQAVYKNFTVSSRRDLRYAYYSNYIRPGNPAFVLREQLPGNKIKFDSVSTPFDPKNLKKSFFIAIFKDANGLPGKVIGSSQQKSGSGGEVILTEDVSGEMLYAMMFEDNGDNKLDLTVDTAVRGEDDLVAISKFKVIQ